MAYTNSKLVSYTKISPNRTSPRKHSIDTITIHCVVGQCSVESLGNVFASTSRKASSNYGIGYDGKIGMYVEEKDMSWCSSSSSNDNRAVTIEVASDTTHPYAVTDKALSSLIELVADICKRNNIEKLIWSTNKSDRVNHRNGCNMTVHRDYANKSCPGQYLYDKHGYIAEQVNQKLGTVSRNYLMEGDEGAEVKAMQEDLIYVGYSCGELGADGYFGSDTDIAVRAFQKDNGLSADGKFGKKSKDKLDTLVAKKKASENETKTIIKKGQQHAIDFTGVKINVDGIVGADTNKMKARVLQHAMNLDYGKTISEDGIFGAKSKEKLGSHYVKKGEKQYLVTAAEILMMLHGIDPNGVEVQGIYGNGLVKAAKQFFGDDGTKITASEFLKLIQ